MQDLNHTALLERIATALERSAPPISNPSSLSLDNANAYVWVAETHSFMPIAHVQHIPFACLKGLDPVAETLIANTRRFAKGLPANNALLWGARGMGKSSLVKAIHADINAAYPGSLVLVEIHQEDLASLSVLLHHLRKSKRRFILFCDDLSFDKDDNRYKSLKTLLDGGIEGRPENVIFYATSNRRHLMPRDMGENLEGTAMQPGETVEEKVSLSDRFGLWLGFYHCSQEIYLQMIDSYIEWFKLDISQDEAHTLAKQWAMTRGGRSGRVAWQFIQDLRGRLGEEATSF